MTTRLARLIRVAQAKPKTGKRRLPAGPSTLEIDLWTQLQLAGLTADAQTEYQALPGRRYRWDVGWASQRLLVEVQGGIWAKGGHSSGVGLTRDIEKLNSAVLAGWRVLAVTACHIKSGQALIWIQEALAQKCLLTKGGL